MDLFSVAVFFLMDLFSVGHFSVDLFSYNLHYSFLQYSQTFLKQAHYIISNCYVSDHILYSICPQLADTLASNSLEKCFTPLSIDFCSKAVQILCSASFNSGIILGTAWCFWRCQTAKMWVNLMT